LVGRELEGERRVSSNLMKGAEIFFDARIALGEGPVLLEVKVNGTSDR